MSSIDVVNGDVERIQRILQDDTHVLFAGATGTGEEFGGKTTTANWWYSNAVESGQYDYGIFVNVKNHGFIKGVKATSIGQIAGQMQQGRRLINFVPGEGSVAGASDRLSEQHMQLAEFVNNLSGSKIVVHDEARLYSGDSLDWFATMAGNQRPANTRSLFVSQRAWQMPQNVLASTPVKVWVGPATQNARQYFRTMEMPEAYDKVEEHTGRYHWNVIVEGRYIGTVEPVPDSYA